MPAGRLAYPGAIKFMIGSFPALFGTDYGTKLQRWCVQRGWALVWAVSAPPRARLIPCCARADRVRLAPPRRQLGLNLGRGRENFFSIGDYDAPIPAHARLLDPTVLLASRNGSASASLMANLTTAATSAGAPFLELWENVSAVRATAAKWRLEPTNRTWAEAWALLDGAMPAPLRLFTLHAGACADVDGCIGVSANGACACYTDR